MMRSRKYGVVYTPTSLADFTANLIYNVAIENSLEIKTVLDPASGECSLLMSAHKFFGDQVAYKGIDVDNEAVKNTPEGYSVIHNDAILPFNVKGETAKYWKNKLPRIDAIIANPPWSTEKIYARETLQNAGFSLVSGQYDSYVLFIELSFNILPENGLMAFIIPDSLFDAQNTNLRKFLCEKTQICVIARLGEKIFDEVARSATVIVCKKTIPEAETITQCFRLSTSDRHAFLAGANTLMSFFEKNVHYVPQCRFTNNDGYIFDIDTKVTDEALLNKIEATSQSLSKLFTFGRGIEISKAGKIVYCPVCGCAQGYKKKQLQEGSKNCTACGQTIPVNEQVIENVIGKVKTDVTVPVYVGEDLHRYSLMPGNYIIQNIKGINYKSNELYFPPKLCIRKTGLGIYCAIDYTSTFVTQTVYILKYQNQRNNVPLEFYLAILNSRVVYYYYLKVYGENEWKSHPYLTKQIIFDLPILIYENTDEDARIVKLAKQLMQNYDHATDLKLEQLIMDRYKLTETERQMISDEMSRLPDLSAVNDMKMEG